MKKLAVILTALTLTNCAYKPVIDTAGRSGTYNEDKAKEITNDIQHCRQFADEHTFRLYDTLNQGWGAYFHYASLGIIPKRESVYKRRVDDCLKGRGHSVVR